MSAHKKHILIVCPGFPENEADTACLSAVQDYLLEFSSIHPHCRFTVIASQYPFKDDAYKWHGLKVYPRNSSKLGLTKKILSWIKTVQLARELHDEDAFDLVHSFWLHEPYFVASRISKKLKLPHVASGGGQEVKSGNRYLRTRKEHIHYVSSSKFQQDLLLKNYGIESTLIPMGIRLENVKAMQAKEIDVLGVGNLTVNKNYTSFLNIVEGVIHHNSNVKVTLIGEGDQESLIRKLISEKGLDKNITLTGQVSRKTVLEHMSKSKVLLHPSNYESFGMVFLEALAHGMHVVSKETGIAQKGDQWHIYSEESEAVDIITDLLNIDSKVRSLTPYKASDMVQNYYKLYQQKLES